MIFVSSSACALPERTSRRNLPYADQALGERTSSYLRNDGTSRCLSSRFRISSLRLTSYLFARNRSNLCLASSSSSSSSSATSDCALSQVLRRHGESDRYASWRNVRPLPCASHHATLDIRQTDAFPIGPLQVFKLHFDQKLARRVVERFGQEIGSLPRRAPVPTTSRRH